MSEELDHSLMVAAWGGDLEATRDALEGGADPDYEFEGNSPLLQAVMMGEYALVDLLLGAGADPDLLHPVNHTGDRRMLSRLLEAGASLAPSGEGSVLHEAIWDFELFRFLIERVQGQPFLEWFDRDFGDTVLGAAVRFGRTELVRYLLDLGPDPNLCDGARAAHTPLKLAARGDVEIVRLLLEAGADPDLQYGLCRSGRMALEEAGVRWEEWSPRGGG